MAEHTDREQLMVELINHARLDPAAEAKRLGISLNDGLNPGTIDSTSKAPLAANFYLVDASRAHSRWMLDTDVFSHTGVNNSTPGQRMADAGYTFTGSWAWGENISWRSLSNAPDAATTAIYNQHDSLFRSAGHRANILSDNFVEVGIGQVRGNFTSGGWEYFASMVTQSFARSGGKIFVTGVIYNDNDGNNFYSAGEGVAIVDLRAGALSTESLSSGGYQIPTGAGIQSIMLGTAVLRATILNENAKIDLVDGVRVDASVSLELVSGINQAKLLGLDDLSLRGTSGNDILTGNKGDNNLNGGDGNDQVDGGSGSDQLYGGNGTDRLSGGSGHDRLSGGSGDDTLLGGTGKDILLGGSGDDRLTGGQHSDTLTGGSGADTFIFTALSDSTAASSGRDIITDFSRSQGDKIDLSAIDANSRVSGNQAFSFIGTDEFSGTSGELRYAKKATSTFFYADVDGDGKADFVVALDSSMTLRASDFVL